MSRPLASFLCALLGFYMSYQLGSNVLLWPILGYGIAISGPAFGLTGLIIGGIIGYKSTLPLRLTAYLGVACAVGIALAVTAALIFESETSDLNLISLSETAGRVITLPFKGAAWGLIYLPYTYASEYVLWVREERATESLYQDTVTSPEGERQTVLERGFEKRRGTLLARAHHSYKPHPDDSRIGLFRDFLSRAKDNCDANTVEAIFNAVDPHKETNREIFDPDYLYSVNPQLYTNALDLDCPEDITQRISDLSEAAERREAEFVEALEGQN